MSTVEQWVTVSEAASAIGISEAKVRSAAQDDAIQTRTTAQGRLEVLVQLLDDEQVQFAKALATTPECSNASESEDASSDEDGAGQPSEAQKNQNPFFKMLHGAEEDNELNRYQRMAGASLIVAQKQADEAAEKVAMLRYELNRSRNRANVAAYAACICVCVALLALFGRGRAVPQSANADTPNRSQDRQTEYDQRRGATNGDFGDSSLNDATTVSETDPWAAIYEEIALARRHQAALATEVDAIRSERRRLEVVVEELAEPLRETSTNTSGFGPASAENSFSAGFATDSDEETTARRKPNGTRRDLGAAMPR